MKNHQITFILHQKLLRILQFYKTSPNSPPIVGEGKGVG